MGVFKSLILVICLFSGCLASGIEHLAVEKDIMRVDEFEIRFIFFSEKEAKFFIKTPDHGECLTVYLDFDNQKITLKRFTGKYLTDFVFIFNDPPNHDNSFYLKYKEHQFMGGYFRKEKFYAYISNEDAKKIGLTVNDVAVK